MDKLAVKSSPYISSNFSTRKIMLDVIIALIPCVIAGVIFFGWGTLILVAVCCVTAFVSELLFTLIKNNKWTWEAVKNSSATDLSCIVTGILLALNVPASLIWAYDSQTMTYIPGSISLANIWMPILGTVFAIVLVKMAFGGIGRNFANPALTARLFMVIAFGSVMGTVGTANIIGLDAVGSATWLSAGRSAADVSANWLNFLIGNKGAAALGETSVIAILIGFIYLTIRKVIDPRLPLLIIGGVAIFAFLFDALPSGAGFADMMLIVAGHVLTGGLMLGAVFMATDYATSPNTLVGNIIYGLGIALLVVLIRVFGAYPEGVSYSIVIMNIVVPLIDKYIYPRAFGRQKAVRGAK
ncbi:MAG TPA: RnfABCDGE type electron transport complex subunit D [Clostridia bacterium]